MSSALKKRSAREDVRVEAPSPVIGAALAVILVCFAVFIPQPPAQMTTLMKVAALAVLLAVLAAVSIFRSRVIVGEDGVVLRFARERFIAYDDITDVVSQGKAKIRLELRSGAREIIAITHRRERKVTADERQKRDALLSTIREAWRAYRAGEAAPVEVGAALARAGRSSTEWRRALLGVGDDVQGYRDVAIRNEDLWRAMEDVRTPEDVRAAAAAVLSRSLDDEGKARVRIVAEATASPRLRIALDAAAEGASQAVDHALDAIGDDVADVAKRRATTRTD